MRCSTAASRSRWATRWPVPAAKPSATLPGPTGYELVNQGGVDLTVLGRKDLTPNTRVSGAMEYLSSYVYRLVFNDNYSQAISSQVASDVVLTHNHNGMIPSVWLDRFESFASTANGDEVRILRLPLVRYDVLDRPLGNSLLYWGLGSSAGYLNRSEPYFHSRNVGRLDFYPHLSMPFTAGGWSFYPEAALRDTALHHQPDAYAYGPLRDSSRSATTRSTARMLKLQSTSGRRLWSAITSFPSGIGSCVT